MVCRETNEARDLNLEERFIRPLFAVADVD